MMITTLEKMGKLGEKVPGGPPVTEEDLRLARIKQSGAKI